jgi:hypothetical protein
MTHLALSEESDAHKEAEDQRYCNLIDQLRESIQQRILEMLAIADSKERHFQICALDEAVENYFEIVRTVRDNLEQSAALTAGTNVQKEYRNALTLALQSLEGDFPAISARLTELQTASADMPGSHYSDGDAGDDREPESLPVDAYTADYDQ